MHKLLSGLAIALAFLIVVVQWPAPMSAAPTMTPTSGIVLFHDDFSTYSGRWTTERSPKSVVEYAESALTMQVLSPGVAVWSVPSFDLDLDHYRLEATAAFQDGSEDSMFGLVLNYENADNFYAILVSPEGDWQFLRRDGDEWIDLTPDEAESFEWTSDTIRLAADVTSDSVILSVDEQVIAEIPLDGELSGELFGLVALAGNGYIDVQFDDVLVMNGVEEND
jgi:hypothetical protein